MAIHAPGGSGAAATAALAERIKPLVVTQAVTEGQTVTLPATDKRDIILNLEPAADLDTVRVVLPATASEGQRCFVGTTRQIMNCLLTADGMTVNNAALMFSAGDNAAFIRNKTNTWSRVLVS